jgi:putative ABC transport system permease protein
MSATTAPRLAVRNVARNRRRSAITLAAILFGVAAVLVLKGFLGAFNELMVENVVQGETGALQIHRKGYLDSSHGSPLDLNMPYDEAMLARIRAVPGVTGVTGRIRFSGLISNGRSQTMFAGRGVDPVKEAEVCPRVGFDLVPGGKGLEAGDYAQVLIGAELAQSLSAVTPEQKRAGGHEGLVDFVTLSSSSPLGRANSLDAQVKGAFNSAFPFENKRAVTVPLKLAQDLVGLEGRVTEYAVAVADLRELDRVRADLQAAMGPEVEVHDWITLRPFFRDVIDRQNFVLGLISLILFVIVLTGIANTMLMTVFERVREIGTMMAVGVRRRQVLVLFLWESAVLGVVGGLLGAALGNGIVAALHHRGIPMKMFGTAQEVMLRPALEAPYVLAAVGVAIAGAVLSAVYPAWKASRLNPVDALRAL